MIRIKNSYKYILVHDLHKVIINLECDRLGRSLPFDRILFEYELLPGDGLRLSSLLRDLDRECGEGLWDAGGVRVRALWSLSRPLSRSLSRPDAAARSRDSRSSSSLRRLSTSFSSSCFCKIDHHCHQQTLIIAITPNQ